jgi:threonine dehydrogenase-like Zn-dependent dehydrogenase
MTTVSSNLPVAVIGAGPVGLAAAAAAPSTTAPMG